MTRSAADLAESRFRQLCCLGLGGEAVMPALLDEVRSIIPSYGVNFFFADEDGELANVWDDNPESPALARLYLEQFHDRPEVGGHPFSRAMRRDVGVNSLNEALTVDAAAFRRSDFYNLVFRPLHYDDFIRLTVREDGHQIGLGSLTVYRSAGDPPFTREERQRLAGLNGFVAHALAEKPRPDLPLIEDGNVGIVIADATGRARHFSKEGRRLLFLATHPRYAPDATAAGAAMLPPALARICMDLAKTLAGDNTASAPAHYHRNVWGGFSFHAQRLEDELGAEELISIAITHFEPLSVRLLRRVGELPLSERQAEICVLLAEGRSLEDVAERLGISPHTANAHGRAIYEKLGIHKRPDLLALLLGGRH